MPEGDGGFYGPFVTVKAVDLTWTRGAPAHFQSSNKVSRGFCNACGTPLTFKQVVGQTGLAIGAFDDPAAIPPTGQLGSPRRMPWIDDLGDLPMREPEEPKIAAYQADRVSYQHPDHDT
ncbi:GFA family protein [Phenylobacterium sp.]|uniref:GFA family protein n=1 Tax=Phenylobacterium sp. TaxID=1871053 RepID=UPI0039837B1D